MKILAVSYSQTGQLHEITNNFLTNLEGADIDSVIVQPVVDYPFPWPSDQFFDIMPDCVHEQPIPLKHIDYKYEAYDLVIFAYQTWFLSVSLPMISLIQDTEFKKRIQDTPVITLSGSRNMWVNAQMKLAKRIDSAGGRLVANIPLVDRAQNLISVVTILHWMLDGKKTKKYNLFPVPGVDREDIIAVKQYSKILQEAIHNDELDTVQEQFIKENAIWVNTSLLFVETAARRLFAVWAGLVDKYESGSKSRKKILIAFKYYLIVALFVISPIVLTVYNVLFVPLLYKRIAVQKQNICRNKFY